MAQANIELVSALRTVANNLKSGSKYYWGHQGNCNCGNLVQVVTKLSAEDIMKYAQEVESEWTEIAVEYCPTSNAPITLIMLQLQTIGLTPSDIHNLEYLDNRDVLKNLPGGFRWLKRNVREDVVVYFETFANMLEDELLKQVSIQSLFEEELVVS